MKGKQSSQCPLFLVPLEQLIVPDHELVRLRDAIEWQVFEDKFGALYHPSRGRPSVPVRRLAAVLILKHFYNLSDEEVCDRWAENPFWKYFSGETTYHYSRPCDPSLLSKWRSKIGPDGASHFLKSSIESGFATKTLDKVECRYVNVDTTVQEKNIAYPTDSRLLFKIREKIVGLAQSLGIPLRQSYLRLARQAYVMANRLFAARHLKRAKARVKKLRTYLGRVMRDVERKIAGHEEVENLFLPLFSLATKIIAQSKDPACKEKVYSLHAPETECIAKGKAHKKYEFGVKVALVATSRKGFVLSCDAHHGRPHDGHTLEHSLTNAQQAVTTKATIKEAYVDRGYRGYTKVEGITTTISGTKVASAGRKKRLRRRSAIEGVIGNIKRDCRMMKNFLLGKNGDQFNAKMAAAAWNFRIITGVIYLLASKSLEIIENTALLSLFLPCFDNNSCLRRLDIREA